MGNIVVGESQRGVGSNLLKVVDEGQLEMVLLPFINQGEDKAREGMQDAFPQERVVFFANPLYSVVVEEERVVDHALAILVALSVEKLNGVAGPSEETTAGADVVMGGIAGRGVILDEREGRRPIVDKDPLARGTAPVALIGAGTVMAHREGEELWGRESVFAHLT